MKKTEIALNKNEIRIFLLIIFTPLLLTFIIEHFGDFSYQSYGGQIENITLSGGSFTTPFGNKLSIKGGQKAYEWHSDDGVYKINGHYTDKLPYYIKGVGKDIIYPIAIIFIGMLTYFITRKYSFKIS